MAWLGLLVGLAGRCARPMPPPGKPELEGPEIHLLEPTDGDTIWDTLRVRIEAEDPSGVRWVKVSLDQRPLWSDSTPPYEIVTSLPEIPDTLHRLKVEAIDRWENKSQVQISVITRHRSSTKVDTTQTEEKKP